MRPHIWRSHNDAKQTYLNSLFAGVLGKGPAVVATAHVPDMHYFRGSFGTKGLIPLWRNREATHANINAAFMSRLAEDLGIALRPADLFCYCYGILSSPRYVELFWEELWEPGIRVPITKDRDLFEEARDLGGRLLWWHTYGERFQEYAAREGLTGVARCLVPLGAAMPDSHGYRADEQAVTVGAGKFGPVSPEVWEFEISGFRVVSSWLGDRGATATGRRSSPLDDIGLLQWTAALTSEFLQLLWVLEATVEAQPASESLLERICGSSLYLESEIPPPTLAERKPLSEAEGEDQDELPLFA